MNDITCMVNITYIVDTTCMVEILGVMDTICMMYTIHMVDSIHMVDPMPMVEPIHMVDHIHIHKMLLFSSRIYSFWSGRVSIKMMIMMMKMKKTRGNSSREPITRVDGSMYT